MGPQVSILVLLRNGLFIGSSSGSRLVTLESDSESVDIFTSPHTTLDWLSNLARLASISKMSQAQVSNNPPAVV